MSYIYDRLSDKDFIVLTELDKNDYYTFIHELNHLVDQHKKYNKEILFEDIIDFDKAKNEFIKTTKEYFKNWPSIIGITEDGKTIKVSDYKEGEAEFLKFHSLVIAQNSKENIPNNLV